ncbi:hypothetical protein [Tenacibaculum sp. SDUM215027]|uniref:hypothetical protein n=1 Tax=Tenacibaculum sp. SDUM215027 TaxID=3422596 RepID=UPI003D312793
MLKLILNLKEVKKLKKSEQIKIEGGGPRPLSCEGIICPSYCHCASSKDHCIFSSGPKEGTFCYSL